MAYEKQIWENLPSTNTPISADRLNHMEDGISEAWEHGGGGAGETLKIGTILPFSGGYSLIPVGYMLCDGSEISRTDYSDLFNIIGTTYGVGDGSTTFNLPNLKGRVPVGQDGDDSDFDTLGETGGSKDLQKHSHPYNISTSGAGGGDGTRLVVWNSTGTTYNNASGAIANTGTGNSGNLQPYLVVKYIIKVSQTTSTQAQVVDGYSTSTTDSYSANYVNKLSNYSTEETVCGRWIDGKPLYRKSVFLNSLPNNTSTIYQHNISNVKSIWFDNTACFVIWNYGQDNQFTNNLPYFNYVGSHIYLANANKTDFEIVTINDRTSLKGYITLLYTKTTD